MLNLSHPRQLAGQREMSLNFNWAVSISVEDKDQSGPCLPQLRVAVVPEAGPALG